MTCSLFKFKVDSSDDIFLKSTFFHNCQAFHVSICPPLRRHLLALLEDILGDELAATLKLDSSL